MSVSAKGPPLLLVADGTPFDRIATIPVLAPEIIEPLLAPEIGYNVILVFRRLAVVRFAHVLQGLDKGVAPVVRHRYLLARRVADAKGVVTADGEEAMLGPNLGRYTEHHVEEADTPGEHIMFTSSVALAIPGLFRGGCVLGCGYTCGRSCEKDPAGAVHESLWMLVDVGERGCSATYDSWHVTHGGGVGVVLSLRT